MKFDGVTAPILLVQLAIGGNTSTDPSASGFVLGVSQLNTGQLGLLDWVDISIDCDRVTFTRGMSGELEDASPGHATLTLDNFSGDYDPTNTAGQYFGSLDVGVPVWIQAIWGTASYDLFRGFIDVITVDAGRDPSVTISCDDGLEVLGRASFTTAYPDGDATGVRVGRILDNAQWPSSLRTIDTGYSTCQATSGADPAGFALPMLNDVLATELGLLAVDGSGNVVFYDRLHPYLNSRSQTVQATVSDANDVDMLALQVSRDRSLVFTQARITRNGGTEQVYGDTAAQTKYGVRTYGGQAGTLLRTDVDAASLATWIVGRFKTPVDRIRSVVIDGATQAQWATLLPLTFLDRMRAIRDYGPNTIDVQVVIIGMEQDITQDSWLFTYNTRNVDAFNPFILNTSQLNTGTVA